MNKISILLIYGGETQQHGTVLGPEGLCRIWAGLDFARKNSEKRFIILLCPGQRPDKHNYPLLKEVMANELEKGLPNNCRIILATTNTWTTSGETLIAMDEISKLSKAYNIETIYTCSSWYHRLRILFFWRNYPEKVEFISAPTTKSFFGLILSLAWEAAGFGKIIFNYLLKR